MAATTSSTAGLALLAASIKAHGGDAYARLTDVKVSYSGQWHRLVKHLQPELVDASFRGGSEERLYLKSRIIGQAHRGPAGHKQVARSINAGEGDVQVWFNDQAVQDAVKRQAAALVTDGYALFLLGPLWLKTLQDAGRSMVVDVASPATVRDGGQEFACELRTVIMRSGLGCRVRIGSRSLSIKTVG